MLRIFKFLGAFIGTLLVVLLIVFGYNMDALVTLYQNSDDLKEGQQWVEQTYSLKGLTEYIGEQPEHVSLASISVNRPDSSILYNEHRPRTMGRLSNIFLLIEYARLVENGDMNPAEEVELGAIDRFQLPYIDASNHDDAVNALRGEGQISDTNTVSLEKVMEIAVEFNDLAASDYLYHRIGNKRLEDLRDTLQMENTDLPAPFSGLYILMNPSLYEGDFSRRLDSLMSLPADTIQLMAHRISERFAGDTPFRHTVLEDFKRDQGLGVSFTKLGDILKVFPKTTALEMATLMKKLQQDSLLSPGISRRVKDILSWPMTNTRLRNDFSSYGAMYDSRMGLLNGIDYGKPTNSNHPFAQAVFFDELQVALWFHMSSNLIHQDFEQRLIWDPALRRATVDAITEKP